VSALRFRALGLAYAWPYRLAHKPLCERFHRDVLHIGKLHLCRGCTALYAGLVLSAVALLVFRPDLATIATLLGAIGVTCVIGSHPALHGRWPRPVRDALRFGTGALPPLALALIATGAPALGASALVALAVLYVVYARARSRRKARACEGCPELATAGVCSGFQLQAVAMRAYDERCAAELGASGFVPTLPGRR
jgi:hypothetical protein